MQLISPYVWNCFEISQKCLQVASLHDFDPTFLSAFDSPEDPFIIHSPVLLNLRRRWGRSFVRNERGEAQDL